MACQTTFNHPVALNIYIVDRVEDEVTENLSESFSARMQKMFPVIQVRATREETLASVLYRAQQIMYEPWGCPLARGYFPSSFMYNGRSYSIAANSHLPIGQILSDPRTNLIILVGSMTLANCCCFNGLVIGCAGGKPVPPPNKYVVQVMQR